MNSVDVSSKQDEILSEVQELLPKKFYPEKIIWSSDYFGTGRVGAFHVLGKYQGRLAVLKIQAARPSISEAVLIEKFSQQNKSTIIRAPKLYEKISWSDRRGYEALVFEYVDGEKVVKSGVAATEGEVTSFFNIYREYRTQSVAKPWLDKPTNYFEVQMDKLFAVASQVNPNSSLRSTDDEKLAVRGSRALASFWSNYELIFQHGHFSVEDLIQAQDGSIVLFSNLFWKWKWPCFDLVFGYHWYMLSLASSDEIVPDVIDQQRLLWNLQMQAVVSETSTYSTELFQAALLERAISTILVDGIGYLPEKKEISRYILEQAREDVRVLTQFLEK